MTKKMLATLAFGSVKPELLGTGEILAKRYQITRDLGEVLQGHQYVADDLQKNRKVLILLFSREFLADTKRYTLLEQEVEQVRQAISPQIQEIYSLESVDRTSFLVEEYVAGTLLVVMTTVSFYLITVYTPTFGKNVLKLSAADSLRASVEAS